MCTFFQVLGKNSFSYFLGVYNFVSGIPELLKRSYTNLEEELFQTDTKFFTKEVFLSTDELSLTSSINKLVLDHPQVTFGSYPSWSNQYYKTKASEGEVILKKSYLGMI